MELELRRRAFGRGRAFTHPGRRYTVQIDNPETALHSCKDQGLKITRIRKSSVSTYDHSHDGSGDVFEDPMQKPFHKTGTPTPEESHESPLEFCRNTIHRLTHKSGTSNTDHHDGPLEFCKDQIHRLTQKRRISAHEQTPDDPLENCKDRINRLIERSRVDHHSQPLTESLLKHVFMYHGSYGSPIGCKKIKPLSPTIEGLDLDFSDFGKWETMINGDASTSKNVI